MTYTVMVKWTDRPKAERLARGHTTSRRTHATIFPTPENAQRAAEQALAGLPLVERWWVAPF